MTVDKKVVMTEPFSSIVCCGKKVFLPVNKKKASVQFEDQDRLTAYSQDYTPVSDNALIAISYPTPAIPRQRVSPQSETPSPEAIFNLHFQRPSPPSPLVNTPLSGKRLPILFKKRNRTSIYSHQGDFRRNDYPVSLEMYGGGDSIVYSLLNKILLNDTWKIYETQVKPGDPFDSTKYTPPRTAITSTLTTYSPPSITYTSPLTIYSLGLQSKKTKKASNSMTATSLRTNIELGTNYKNKDDHGSSSVDKVDSGGVSGNKDECVNTSGCKDNNFATKAVCWRVDTNENSSLAIKQPIKGTLNIIGSKLPTPKKRCQKVEVQRCPKVKYSRGVSTTGALYAFCCRAPYRARATGVTPNSSICPQYAICYNKNVFVNSPPKVESLFTFMEEITAKERNTLSTDINTHMNRLVHNKQGKSSSENKKKETLNVEGKKLKAYSNSNDLSDADHECQGSQRSLPKNVPNSSKENRLSLRDDFPFHCFLLFQFENRKKVMTRLSKVPTRYEQHVRERQKRDAKVKNRETSKVRSRLVTKLSEKDTPKLRKVKDVKTESNECGNGTSIHAKYAEFPEDVVGCQQVDQLQQQTDQISQVFDNTCAPTCEVSLEQSSVDASRWFNSNVTDSLWQNYETNEQTYGDSLLNVLQNGTFSTKGNIACTGNVEVSVNVLESGLTRDTVIDHTPFYGRSSDSVKCENSFELHERKVEGKEACLSSVSPDESKSRLFINKRQNKEEEFLEVMRTDDESQFVSNGSDISFQLKQRKHDVVGDIVHCDQSIDGTSGKDNLITPSCNDFISKASCLSGKLYQVITTSVTGGNEDRMITENISKTKLIHEKGSDHTKRYTEIKRCSRTYPSSNNVAYNKRKDGCMSAEVKGANKVLPLISTIRNDSTITDVVTAHCIQNEEPPSLPIIMDTNCRSNTQGSTSSQILNGSESMKTCSKLRPNSCFCRAEPVKQDEQIDTAFPVKLSSATVCSESSSKKNRCFYSESPDSGISVESRNSSSHIPTEKVICTIQRNRNDVKPCMDTKFKNQKLHFREGKHHSLLNSKTLTKLEINPSGSNFKVNNWRSLFDSQLSNKDFPPSAGSTILTNKRSHAHYPSPNLIPISSNTMSVNVDNTQYRELSTSSISDLAASSSDTASTLPKFPVRSRSKTFQAPCAINKMELTLNKPDVIPLPKVMCDIQTRLSTGYCKDSNLHRGMRHKAQV